MKHKIPDLELEQYLLKELPLKRQAEIESILAEDSTLSSRLQELKNSNDNFFKRFPAGNHQGASGFKKKNRADGGGARNG